MKFLKHLFTALLLLCTTVATAHDFEVSGICYNITDATSITVEVTYKGSSYDAYSNEYTGDVVIPESVAYNGKTYSVTSIGDYAFYFCSRLTSIEIPNSVTSIGDYAFYDCSWLISVEIPNSVTSIGDSAFSWCFQLTSIVIPNSVTSIGSSAFSWCAELTSVVIGNSVTSIGNYAFEDCTSLKDLRIEDGEGTLSLGYNEYNSSGTGKGLFYDCPLETLYLGRNLSYNTGQEYGYSPFFNKTTLASITIGNSVTRIESDAFGCCSGLTSVEIPNSVTSIGNYAFYFCSRLTSIEIPNSVTSIGSLSFWGTAWYNNQPNGVVYAGNVLYEYKGDMPSNTSIKINEGTSGIAGRAFRYCSGLISVEIPNSVTSIGDDAFYDCSGLTSIVVAEGNAKYDSRENCNAIIETATNALVAGCKNTIIPNSVTSIGYSAFYNCSGLTSIVIPNSVTSIGEEAFYGCKNLKTVINNSNLNFGKGTKSYGYIAYYADIVITPVNGISPITSLAELSNSSVYYIYQPYHSKGATSWAVAKDGDALKSNKDLNIEIDKNDTRQQFAILSIDGGVTRYLYHVAEKMFVNLDGSLSATPVDAINFMNGAYTNIFIAYFDNEHYVNVGDKQEMIIDDWDTPDGGNSCLIIPVGEFDPSNALEMFEGYTTEIDEMQDENVKAVYDLSGRRIVDAEYLERGVYIVNGKKILVK